MKIFYSLFLILILVSCGQKKAKNQQSNAGDVAQVQTSKKHPGELAYKKHCMSCHQRDAGGVPGMYPPLADNKVVSGDKNELIKIVLDGMSGEIEVNGEIYNGVMASYRNLPDAEIAKLLNYLRSGFKNEGDEITSAEVKAMR